MDELNAVRGEPNPLCERCKQPLAVVVSRRGGLPFLACGLMGDAPRHGRCPTITLLPEPVAQFAKRRSFPDRVPRRGDFDPDYDPDPDPLNGEFDGGPDDWGIDW